MMARLLTAFALVVALAAPALAQSERELAEMRLQMQALEERVRLLTGEVERLQFELRQARAGQPAAAGSAQPGAVAEAPLAPPAASSEVAGAPPQDLGTLSVAEGDPLIAPDGALAEGAAPVVGAAPADPQALGGPGAGEPLDLSTLAREPVPEAGSGATPEFGAAPEAPADPEAPATTRTAALSGSPRDEYDLAYGYILTGDYAPAEEHFRAWLEAFPDHGQADDARFWLAESQLQQGKHREAANGFLDLYKRAPQGRKAPDTLVKLGASLAALGERDAACATLAEVDKRYPDAPGAVQSRLAAERQRAGC